MAKAKIPVVIVSGIVIIVAFWQFSKQVTLSFWSYDKCHIESNCQLSCYTWSEMG
jgi:hypothetical protein